MKLLLLLIIVFLYSFNSIAETINVITYGETSIKNQYVKKLKAKYPALYKEIDLQKDSITDNKGIFIVVGSMALNKIIELKISNPIIAVFVKESNFYHTLQSIKHKYLSKNEIISLENVGAIYSDPSLEKQIELIKKIFGSRSSFGVITSPITYFLQQSIQEIASKNDLSVKFVNFSKGENINKVINSLKNQEVVLAISDNLVWNSSTLKNIVLSTYRNEQPILGFSRNIVKAGAIATYYADMDSIVMETLDRIKDLKKNNIGIRSPSKYNSLITNGNVLRSLSLKDPKG
jgi:hypothetical protein